MDTASEAEVIQFYNKLRRASFSAPIVTGHEVLYPLQWHELDADDKQRYREQCRREKTS